MLLFSFLDTIGTPTLLTYAYISRFIQNCNVMFVYVSPLVINRRCVTDVFRILITTLMIITKKIRDLYRNIYVFELCGEIHIFSTNFCVNVNELTQLQNWFCWPEVSVSENTQQRSLYFNLEIHINAKSSTGIFLKYFEFQDVLYPTGVPHRYHNSSLNHYQRNNLQLLFWIMY